MLILKMGMQKYGDIVSRRGEITEVYFVLEGRFSERNEEILNVYEVASLMNSSVAKYEKRPGGSVSFVRY